MIAAGWWWADNDGINVRRRWEKAQRGSLVPAVRAVHGWQAGEEGGAKAARHRVCSPQHRVLGQVVDEGDSAILLDCKLECGHWCLTCRPCYVCLAEFSAGGLPASCSPSLPSGSWWRPWGCSRHPSTQTCRPSCPGGREGHSRSTSAPAPVCPRCPGLQSGFCILIKEEIRKIYWNWKTICSYIHMFSSFNVVKRWYMKREYL